MSPPIGRLPASPPCPFCRREDTELMSPFGSHASVSTYWCRRCRSPFELLKWTSGDAEAATGGPDPEGAGASGDTDPSRTGG